MLKHLHYLFFSLLLVLTCSAITVAGPDAQQVPTIAEKTAGLEKLTGYFNLYWDARQGKLWLEIDKWEHVFLYQSGLKAGIGSNDIGLDRGQLGATRIVRFARSGPKVLLIHENLEYRAVSDDADERQQDNGDEYHCGIGLALAIDEKVAKSVAAADHLADGDADHRQRRHNTQP